MGKTTFGRLALYSTGLVTALGLAGCGAEPSSETEQAADAAQTDAQVPETGSPAPVAQTAPSATATPASASIYPVTVKTDRPATTSEAAAARPALAREFADVEQMEGHTLADYTVAMADLDGDGRKDMIVQVRDFGYCGSAGCSGYAILATPSGFSDKIINLGVNYYDTITVLPETAKGMHNMRYDGADYTFRWNGKEYQ